MVLSIINRLEPKKLLSYHHRTSSISDYYGIDVMMSEFCAFRAAIALLKEPEEKNNQDI